MMAPEANTHGLLALMPPKRPPKWQREKLLTWKSSLPFLDNSRAALVHRPRTVQTVTIHKEPHIAVLNWCGNGFAGKRNLSFLAAHPEGKLLCARCEAQAVKAGLPSAAELTGRHVHLGKVVAVQVCCNNQEQSND